MYSRLCLDTKGASVGSKLKQEKCNPRRDDQNFQCDLVVRTAKRRRANVCWTAGRLWSEGSQQKIGQHTIFFDDS